MTAEQAQRESDAIAAMYLLFREKGAAFISSSGHIALGYSSPEEWVQGEMPFNHHMMTRESKAARIERDNRLKKAIEGLPLHARMAEAVSAFDGLEGDQLELAVEKYVKAIREDPSRPRNTAQSIARSIRGPRTRPFRSGESDEDIDPTDNYQHGNPLENAGVARIIDHFNKELERWIDREWSAYQRENREIPKDSRPKFEKSNGLKTFERIISDCPLWGIDGDGNTFQKKGDVNFDRAARAEKLYSCDDPIDDMDI